MPEDSEELPLTLQGENKELCEWGTPVARRVLSLLDELNTTRTGTVLFKQIERILQENEVEHTQRENVLLVIVQNFLDTYIKHLEPGSSLHLQVKLIQKQLKEPVNSTEIQSLRKFIDMYLLHMSRMDLLDTNIIRKALCPLLEYYGTKQEVQDLMDDEPAERNNQQTELNNQQKMFTKDILEELIDDLLPSSGGTAEQKLHRKYKNYLGEQAQQSDSLRSELARRINVTVKQHEQFGVMLEVIRNGLREASSIDDLELLREALAEDVNGLMDVHHVLLENLDETRNYFKMIETDSRHLSDELARVRQLSITDELTGLPNRRAFMQRLEDEMGRAHRYGFNLALAMIDLDHFKSINDHFGHPAGDEVLRFYSGKLFTTFRQHDLASRFGGEEFAVLFPNTSRQGALAALEKVRGKALRSKLVHNDVEIEIPSFSAGLTMFVATDSISSFIKRADSALYNAKTNGRNRTEVVKGLASTVSENTS